MLAWFRTLVDASAAKAIAIEPQRSIGLSFFGSGFGGSFNSGGDIFIVEASSAAIFLLATSDPAPILPIIRSNIPGDAGLSDGGAAGGGVTAWVAVGGEVRASRPGIAYAAAAVEVVAAGVVPVGRKPASEPAKFAMLFERFVS